MSGNSIDNDLKHYFKAIKSLFPTYGDHEKDFLSVFMEEVKEYASSVSSLDYAQLVSHFGEPNIIASDYFANADTAYLQKRIKTAKYVKTCVVVVIVLALIGVGVKVGFAYKSYVEGKDAYIHATETVIEEN
ncbi:MAG: hypothetical protein LBR26_06055 [Prevotella sp.]|nr:hypothetical protein [Prevotella sp.]